MVDSVFQECYKYIRRKPASVGELVKRTNVSRQYITKVLDLNYKQFRLFKYDNKWYALDKNRDAYPFYRLVRSGLVFLEYYPEVPPAARLEQYDKIVEDYLRWKLEWDNQIVTE